MPVSVYGYIDQIFPPVFLIVTGEQRAGSILAFRRVCLPGDKAVEAHGRKTNITGFQIPADSGMLHAECDHILEEFKQVFVFLKQRPVQPGDPVVLTVGIVVAVSCIGKLIPGEEHGSPSAAHEHRTGVFDHLPAQGHNIFVFRLAFLSAVPAVIVIESVCIIPSVCLVVFLIIAVQIV